MAESNGQSSRMNLRRRKETVETDSDSDVKEVIQIPPPETKASKKQKTKEQPDVEEIRAPIPQTNDVLSLGDPFALLANAQSSSVGQFSDLRKQFKDQKSKKTGKVPPQVFDSLRDFQGDTQAYIQSTSGTISLDTGSSRNNTLSDLFRLPVEIMTYGTFDDACAEAVRKVRWLLVNIHNCAEFPCQKMIRDCFRADAVKEIIQENFVFWSVNHDSTQGLRYCTHYQVAGYPHMSIIDPRTGQKVNSYGEMGAMEFCNLFFEFLADKPSYDPAAAAAAVPVDVPRPIPKVQRNNSVEIIDPEQEELEKAMRLSLEEEERRKAAAEPKEGMDAVIEFVDDDCDVDEKPAVVSIKAEQGNGNVKQEQAPEITWQQFLGSPSDPEVALKMRLPSGTSLDLNLPDSSQLQAVFLYLSAQGFPVDKYDVLLGYPQRSICSSFPAETILRDAGLTSRQMLLVKERE